MTEGTGDAPEQQRPARKRAVATIAPAPTRGASRSHGDAVIDSGSAT